MNREMLLFQWGVWFRERLNDGLQGLYNLPPEFYQLDYEEQQEWFFENIVLLFINTQDEENKNRRHSNA